MHTHDFSIERELLTLLPPSSLRELARAFKVVELADRRHEMGTLSAATTVSDESKELAFILQWRILEFRILLFLVLLSGGVLNVLYWLRVLPKRIRSPIEDIEKGILDAAKAASNPERVLRVKTVDELEAEGVIHRYRKLFDSLAEKFEESPQVLAYITQLSSSALELGQRWAEIEDRHRRAKAEEDRAENFWRSGFLVRAFGFGAIKLFRQLSTVLVVGMSIPWLIQYFNADRPKYETIHNILWGVGWTFILWAVTLTVTLFFNDRRMKQIYKRSHLASLKVEAFRARELASQFASNYQVMLAIVNMLYPRQEDQLSILVYDGLESIHHTSVDYLQQAGLIEEKIRQLSSKVTIGDRLRALVDTNAQGGGIELDA